jgi:glycosyltransferase involved in cell wall biosynthesis
MPDSRPDRLHVGYILKQYPRLSETFILNEILGVEDNDLEVSIFSLRHATEGRFHPSVGAVKARVHYSASPDKAAFLEALRALQHLDVDRLPEVLAFIDLLPPDRRARVLLNAIEVADRAASSGIDHLHAHFLTVAAHTAHLVHLLTGLPYTVTAHAKDIYRHSVDWDLAARIAEKAVAVVTVCEANLRFLAHRLDGCQANLVRIYNGLGPQDPPAAASAVTPGLVLGVGRLVEKKGFDLLLAAVADLAADRSDLQCVLVGDGDQRGELEQQAAELGIEDRVTFTGPLPQNEVAAWLRRAQVMVAPCRVGNDGNQDALPTVLIEALAAGLPAVATPVAGIPEIIEHGVEGLIVPCGDPEALGLAIVELLDNAPRRDAMAAAGPAKLSRCFDRTNTIAELIDTFNHRMLVP